MLRRSIPVWLSILLFSSLMVFFYSADGASPYHNAGHQAVAFSMVLLFGYFGVTLIAVESGRRERAERTDRLRETLPYPIWQWLLGRWLALLIPATLLAWLPLFIYLREFGTRLFEPGAGIGVVYLACFAIPAWFAVLAGFAIGDRVPGGWSYVVGLAFYLTFNFLIHFVLLPSPSIGMSLFDMFAYINGFQFHDYSLLWGFYIDGQHGLHRLFYLCLTIGIASGMLVHYTGKRREKGIRAYQWVGLATLVTACVVSFIYFPEAAHRYTSAREVTNLSLAAVESGVDSRLYPLHYQLDMQVGSSNWLTVQADIDMRTDQGERLTELMLYLDPLFSIDRAMVNGQSAGWRREGSGGLVRITPPTPVMGELHVSLAYSGQVKTWAIELNFNGGEKIVRHAVVGPSQVRLPYDLVWYPVTSRQLDAMAPYTGARPFGYRGDAEDRAGVGARLDPIVYELTVAHRKPMLLIASDYTSRSESGKGQHRVTRISAASEEPLMLIGGAFQLVEASGTHSRVSLIASNQANHAVAERAVEETALLLDRMMEFMARTEAQHGLDVLLPPRLSLLPTYPAHYPLAMTRDARPQLLAGKYTSHFRYGWLEVDEAYPSSFEPSQWALLWQWLEVLQEADGTQAPMQAWLTRVREYLLFDPDAEPSVTGNRSAILAEELGRDNWEAFLWDYYHALTDIDPDLSDRDKSFMRGQLYSSLLSKARGEKATDE